MRSRLNRAIISMLPEIEEDYMTGALYRITTDAYGVAWKVFFTPYWEGEPGVHLQCCEIEGAAVLPAVVVDLGSISDMAYREGSAPEVLAAFLDRWPLVQTLAAAMINSYEGNP